MEKEKKQKPRNELNEFKAAIKRLNVLKKEIRAVYKTMRKGLFIKLLKRMQEEEASKRLVVLKKEIYAVQKIMEKGLFMRRLNKRLKRMEKEITESAKG